MSLQVDYRPETLDEVVGNEQTVDSIKSVIKRDNPPNAFLFTGNSGCGKTTLARILANELGIDQADITEMNASSDRGINDIRAMADSLKFSPLNGDRKFVLLDEAHMLTKPSQEALLKTLEEPPSYAHIAICTTNPEALKQTLKRRCHQYEVDDLSYNELMKLIKQTLKAEKVPLKRFSRELIEKLIDLADGSPGQCMKLLDMIIDMSDKQKAMKTLESVGFGGGSAEVIDICKILVDGKINEKTRWKKLSEILKTFKTDGESARRPVLGYLNKVLLSRAHGENADIIAMRMECFKGNLFDSGTAGFTMACYEACRVAED